ncbi:MAG TPA: aldolase/citrate lyase family protein [Rudaea sp.]|nr:aldolase/citrate lyase family protein [Rudaea sp.]
MSYGSDMVLTLFTADPVLADAADRAGVDRIGIDMEQIGKAARQQHLATWISDHTETDLATVRPMLQRAQLFVRCNPVHRETAAEIDRLVDAGVKVIMLPFFKTVADAERFIRMVDERAHPVLLLETTEAAAAIADLCRVPGVSEIHIGLNDMRLSLGWPSHFHVLVSDFLVNICAVILNAGHRLGVGGVGRAGDNELPVPADLVSAQIVRLRAAATLVSRSFFRAPAPCDLNAEFRKLRAWFDQCASKPDEWHAGKRRELEACIRRVFHDAARPSAAPAVSIRQPQSV